MKRATVLLVLFVALALLAPLWSQTRDNKTVTPPDRPPQLQLPKLGLWLAIGRDKAGTTWTAPLVFAKDIDAKTNMGFFDWKSEVGIGREVFKGTFDPKTRKISLQGTHFAFKEGNIVLGTYEAIVSADGMKMEKGTWVGGIEGEWTAVWKADLPTGGKK